MAIKQEIITDDKDHQRALEKAQKQIEALEAKYVKLAVTQRKNAQEGQKGGQVTNETFEKQIGLASTMLTRLGGLTAGYFAMSKAVSIVNDQIQRMQELQQDNAFKQLSTAALERQFVSNLGPVSGAERDKQLAKLYGIADSRGLTRDEALRGAVRAIGFAGEPGPALEALDVSARFDPNMTDELTESLLKSRNVTRSEDLMANLGYLVAVQKTSPVTSTSDLGKYLSRAGGGIRLHGDSDVEAAALYNALANQLGDTEGELANTASQRAAAALDEALKGRTELKSTRERIEFLQKNPAMAKRVADTIEQGQTKGAIVELFSNANSRGMAEYRKTLASVPADEASRRQLAFDQIALNEGTDVQKLAGLHRRLGAVKELMAFGDTRGPLAHELRQFNLDMEKQLGATKFERLAGGLFEVGGALSGRDPLETEYVRTAWTRDIAKARGNDEAVAILSELLEEIKRLRAEQLTKDDARRERQTTAPRDGYSHNEW